MISPKELLSKVAEIAQNNSVILVQVPEEQVKTYAESLHYLNKITSRINVFFVAMPDTVKFTVVSGPSRENTD